MNYTKVEIETADWRASAAVVGIARYLNYCRTHGLDEDNPDLFMYDDSSDPDIFSFYGESVTEERYLQFVEAYFMEDMHHCVIENLLCHQNPLNEEKIKLIDEKMKANTILKKLFGKLKYSEDNRSQILECIRANRKNLIKETFRYKKNLYANFANPNQLLSEKKDVSRLMGDYVDLPKKGKSTGYYFDMARRPAEDNRWYDFIPFAFVIGPESFFINDNGTVQHLIETNNQFQKAVKEEMLEKETTDIRRVLFKMLKFSSDFLDYDVEIIIKNQNRDFYETLMLRKSAIEIFKKIKHDTCFSCVYKTNDNNYISIRQEVENAVINQLLLDRLIDLLLRNDSVQSKNAYAYLIDQLIYVNLLNKGDEKMRYVYIKKAKDDAHKVTEKLISLPNGQNKLKSYRVKLGNAVKFKDERNYFDIMIQLANYTDVYLESMDKLLEDFNENKEIAYAFINALGEYSKEESK